MQVLEASGEILWEIIGNRRIQTTTYLVLNKKPIIDIANVKKVLIVTIHIDAINYYDRVIHPFTSLYA